SASARLPWKGLKNSPEPPTVPKLANPSDEHPSVNGPETRLKAFTDQLVGVASVWGPMEVASRLPLESKSAPATPLVKRPRTTQEVNIDFIVVPIPSEFTTLTAHGPTLGVPTLGLSAKE